MTLIRICQDDACSNKAEFRLINGEEVINLCRTCFFSNVDDLVENNETITFTWGQAFQGLKTCEVS